MCILCVEIAKGKMTKKEIASAYMEANVDGEHVPEVMEVLEQNGLLEDVSEILMDIAWEKSGYSYYD